MISKNQIEKINQAFIQNVEISHSGTGTMFFTYEANDKNLNRDISKLLEEKTQKLSNIIFVNLDFYDIMPKSNPKIDYITLFYSILDNIIEELPIIFDKFIKEIENLNKDENSNMVVLLERFFSDFLPLALIIAKYIETKDFSSFEQFLIDFKNKEYDIYVQNQKLIFSNILKILTLVNYRLVLNIHNIDKLYQKMTTTNKKGTARFLKEITISDYYPSITLSIFAEYNFWVEIFTYQEAMARRFFRPINKLIFLDVLNKDRALELIEKTFSSLDQMKFENILEKLTEQQGLQLYQETFDFIENIYYNDDEILSEFDENFFLEFFKAQYYVRQILRADPDLIYFLVLRGFSILFRKTDLDDIRFFKNYLPMFITEKKIYIVLNPNKSLKSVKNNIKKFPKNGKKFCILYDIDFATISDKEKYKNTIKSNDFIYLDLKHTSTIIASACYFKHKDIFKLKNLLKKGGYNFDD